MINRLRKDSVSLKKPKKQLVVIGNGMTGCQFCVEFLNLELNKEYELTIFGKEPNAAYDRVKLSEYARDKNLGKITLKPEKWYKKNNINLCVGEEVTEINKTEKTITTIKGNSLNYDKLVFATGSNAFLPPVPGNDEKGVFVYRTTEDVDRITAFAEGRSRAIVVGGGLLGLEAASLLKDQGLETHIVEMAEFLMPRQLDQKASSIFTKNIIKKGYTVHTGVQVNSVTRIDQNSLKVQFNNEQEFRVDIVVFAVGIRPNSALAEKASISCSPAKGIMINDQLESSDEDIYAIGECARHKGQVYGLVAPCYEMAEILCRRLKGEDINFRIPDMSTRLKMLGEDVISLGQALQPYDTVEYHENGYYRKLVMKDGELVGAIGIGKWDESGQIQSAILNRMPVRKDEEKRFKDTGELWEKRNDISKWPDSTLICNCMKVSKGEIIDCINSGCTTVKSISEKTGCSTVCGSCEPLVAELSGDDIVRRQKPERGLFISAVLTLVVLIFLLAMPVYWTADSYTSQAYKVTTFLNQFLIKQITGYTMLGLCILALLLSLRKRLKFINFGKFKYWRLLHAIFALVSLIVLIFHTGFSTGSNLNCYLFTTFLAINFLGLFTAMVASFEYYGLTRISSFCRRWRSKITFLHIITFWPFPLLIIFHIVQAYYF